MKPNQLVTADGTATIAVQACTEEWANVSIFLNSLARWKSGGSVQHRVSVPGLEFESEPLYYNEMKDDVYRVHLAANREALLALIKKLNDPSYPTAGYGDREAKNG
ncbi:MAG: hypothetical protein FOGNACKC_00870 [Anaerolineae bacterium]|nr:hypothetical protein [Anaerolineae bacterium]